MIQKMKNKLPCSVPAYCDLGGLTSRDGEDSAMAYRTGEIVERAPDDASDDSLELSVSSTTPYLRWGRYSEVLDHSPKAVDLKYIRRDGKILVDHNSHRVDSIVGRVDKCWLDGDVCRVRMVWDDSDRAKEVRRLVENKMLRTVSIGYRVNKWHEQERDDGLVDIKVTRWELLEVSFVAVPADSTVGVGRSDKFLNYSEMVKGDDMPDRKDVKDDNPAPDSAPDIGRIQAEARKDEQERIRAILEVGEKHDLEELAREAVDSGESYSDFNLKALKAIGTRNDERKTQEPHRNGDVDLTETEVAQFSLRKLCLAQAHGVNSTHWRAAAYEREVCEAAFAEMPSGYETRGNVIPDRILSGFGGSLMPGAPSMANLIKSYRSAGMVPGVGLRAPIDTGPGTTGAALVGNNLMPGSFIEYLYDSSILQSLGITMLPGLVGNVEIPRQASKANPSEVAEGEEAPESILTLNQVPMSAKHIAVQGSYTRNMMLQSTPAIEGLIRMDFARGMALRMDYLGIKGSGADNQPRGLKNTLGVNTVDVSSDGDPTWVNIVAMIQKIKEDNAVVTKPEWVFPADVWAHMASTLKVTNSAVTGFILDADSPAQVLCGLPYMNTELLGAGELLLGCWNQLLCGEWGGLEVITDPYSQAGKGNTRICMFKSIDFACRHPESFCFGS